MNNRLFIICARVAVVLALFVVVLGAYVRLSHAGLGCPDWPGCYGEMVVSGEIADTEHLYDRPFESGKAWKEMIHRYAAGILGLLIFAIAIMAWRQRNSLEIGPGLPTLIAILVVFQALLGMWTVTLLLKPVIVMAHLLGGLAILSLLFWLNLKLRDPSLAIVTGHPGITPWAIAAIVIVALQISLGGWTSANYAALICPDFPTCQGSWWPPMDFQDGFILWRGLGVDYEGGVLPAEGRTAIHMAHRIGAVITALFIGLLGLRLILKKDLRMTGIILLLVLSLQILLGISNVLLRLPLPVAVAHNGIAAVLLLTLVTLLHQVLVPKSSGSLV